MIRIVSGDLFASGAPVLVCPTNQVGVMGAGLARAFAERHPGLADDYARACRAGRHDFSHPYPWSAADAGPLVLCVATKRHWREPSRLGDVSEAIAAMGAWCARNGCVRVAVPALGCGLGGLAWEQVRALCEQHLADSPCDWHLHRP